MSLLLIVLIILFIAAIIGGGAVYSTAGILGFSPLGLIILILFILWLSGNL